MSNFNERKDLQVELVRLEKKLISLNEQLETIEEFSSIPGVPFRVSIVPSFVLKKIEKAQKNAAEEYLCVERLLEDLDKIHYSNPLAESDELE